MLDAMRAAATKPTAAPPRAGLWPVTLDRVVVAAPGRRLIDRLSLTLAPGATTAIMGPNGAGKSLALRLIAGLIAPESGRISWGGAMAPGLRRVGLVFQRPVLLRRSVAGNLDHALTICGIPRATRPARIADLLRMGQLDGLAGRPARVLSGGEQQRLALVRALAADPALLLLDEPTASLDPQATAAIEALIARAIDRGTRVVLVTHDRGQVGRLADEVIFLHCGRVTERTPAARFLAAPTSPEGRAYLDGRLLF